MRDDQLATLRYLRQLVGLMRPEMQPLHNDSILKILDKLRRR